MPPRSRGSSFVGIKPMAALAAMFLSFAGCARERPADEAAATLERLEATLGDATRGGDRLRELSAQRGIAAELSRLGEHRLALTALQQALALAQELEDTSAAELAGEVGEEYWHLGEPRKAQASFTTAVELARAIDDRRTETTALNNLAVVSDHLGELEVALLHYDEALDGWRDLGDRAGEAATLHNIGTALVELDRIPSALDALARALELEQFERDPQRQAATLTAIGWARFWGKEVDAAIEIYGKALELRAEAGDQRGKAATLDRLGTALRESKRYAESREAYLEALDISRELGSERSEAHTLSNLGLLSLAEGSPEPAVVHLKLALEAFRRLEDTQGESLALLSLARAARDLADLGQARKLAEASIERIEELWRQAGSHGIRTSLFSTLHEHYEFYLDLLLELHKLNPGGGYDRLALEAKERGRSRSLLAMLGLLATPTRELDVERGRLNAKIRSTYRRRSGLLGDPSAASELAEVERELRDLLLEDEKVEARQLDLASAASISLPAPASVDEMRALLDDGTVLLTYGLGESRAFVGVITSTDALVRELPERQWIEAKARALHKHLSNSHLERPRSQADRIAVELGTALLEPVAGLVAEAERLVVIADGALEYVPFSLLRLPEDGASMLAGREVVTLPSASVLAEIRRRSIGRGAPRRQIAVLADPTFGGAPAQVEAEDPTSIDPWRFRSSRFDRSFEPLPYTRLEAESILALVPKHQALGALGSAASRELVLSGRLSGSRVLHFATHGVIDDEFPELSGVALSEVDAAGKPREGFLFVNEIYGLDLASKLVVLSACQTALGDEVRGEGLVGLMHAFMAAGADSVLVSLWKVGDQPTFELMTRFYQGLFGLGLEPSEALRRAQLSLAEGDRWSEPFYWAAFTLQGDWR